jgi:hypothetical protein
VQLLVDALGHALDRLDRMDQFATGERQRVPSVRAAIEYVKYALSPFLEKK